MDKVVIIGGRGSAVAIGEQIYDSQIKKGNVEFLGYAFDDETLGDEINGFPILCKTYEANKKFEKYKDVKFIYQLYRPDLIKERIKLLKSFNIKQERFYTFIHHTAMVAKSAQIGYGAVVLANSVVNSNSIIGDHSTIHSGSHIAHDTIIGKYNFIAAQNAIGSSINIGEGNFVGLNSSINNYITIGNYNFIGMSSNVIKGLNSNEKVFGNPAKPFETDIKPL